MAIKQKLVDTLTNFVSGLGTDRDKASASHYSLHNAMQREELVAFYRSSWLAAKIVETPARDTFRKWRSWQADAQQINLIEAEEKRLQLRQKLYEAYRKARLYGGAALYISDGSIDTKEPLDIERIGKGGIKFINVMMPWQFNNSGIDIDRNPASVNFGKPSIYRLSLSTTASGVGEVLVHPSRLIILSGATAESYFDSSNAIQWGESVLEGRKQAIKNADEMAANIISLVYEAKIDIIKVPDFMAQLSDPMYESRMLQRFKLASMGKGINGTLILDTAEEYEQKTASFATLDSLLDKFLQIAAGAADMPITKLLGVSPSGLSSTGEHDLRNYYDEIQSIQENIITPTIAPLDEVLIRSALGTRPEDISYVWSSLWQSSDKERAEIGKMGSEIINMLNSTGLYQREILAKAGANFMLENAVLPGFDIDEQANDYEFESEDDKV